MKITSTVNYQPSLRTTCVHVKSNSTISTDAPVDNNGKGSTFSPTDLVATALAACMITVMAIKAEANKITFNAVTSDVQKVMESNPRRIVEIKIVVTIKENWNKKERELMEQTALNCPVAKSLHSELLQEVEFVYTNDKIS